MTRMLAEQTITLSQEQGMVIWLGAGYGLNGYVLVEQGQMAEGIGQLEHLNASFRDMGTELSRVMQIPVLADAYARAGRVAEGLALLEDGLQVALDTGYRMMEPDLYRSKGDLLLANGSPEEAEACFQQAIESARQTTAKSWELRAALSLCRLWQRQGKSQAARNLLFPIYDWFTEGFDTADLQEARVLLDDLSAQLD
jgi:predicted ATPase